MLYKGALYSNLHTYSMILVILVLMLTIVQGTGGDLYVTLLLEGGGGVLCPSFKQKDGAKFAASAGTHSQCAAIEISSFCINYV